MRGNSRRGPEWKVDRPWDRVLTGADSDGVTRACDRRRCSTSFLTPLGGNGLRWDMT